MTIAYFDCFNGASGDMIVGALLAAGADLDRLREDLAVLALPHVELRSRRLERQGIHATKFDVVIDGRVEGFAPSVSAAGLEPHAHDHAHAHDDDHAHLHGHEPSHGHDGAHPDAHPGDGDGLAAALHGPHRTLGEVERVLQRLSEPARGQAIAIFRRLAAAEAAVHGTSAPFVHFHEVGMDDAIVDVASAVLCLQQLGVSQVHCSPLPLGRGMVRCAHGRMPVPVPAVVELLAGCPTYDNGEEGELVTPTGAAILTGLASAWGPPPAWTLGGVGYGAGGREGKHIPNLLRVMLGTPHPAAASPAGERLVEIAANIDDMNPQLYGPLVEGLLAAGALDVTLTPTVMKKGRPGIVLGVVARESDREALGQLILRETTSLGFRFHPIERQVLDRSFEQVATRWGPVAVKLGRSAGEVLNVMPEFEDCRRLATASGVPLKAVWQEAEGLAMGFFGASPPLG